jgi:CDP-diacylglycerol pyrophosphatase
MAASIIASSALSAAACADPLALWRIVHDKCVVDQETGKGPSPCQSVDLSEGEAEGVAILKDQRGVAQMLAIPTRRVTGVEDPQMLEPDAPKVFAAAWKARTLVNALLPRPLPRENLAVAINSKFNRTQDQLHVHVDCLAKGVADALAGYGGPLDGAWRAMTSPLNGRLYWARRLDSVDLADVRPLDLLANGVEGARADMGDWSLAAVGTTFAGKPGFILLADRFSDGRGGHAEDLQDHDCGIARSPP